MKGATKYLHEVIGLSARLVSSQGIKKIHIVCQEFEFFEHTLDLSDVSPGDIASTLMELCETDPKLKLCLGYRSIRVDHFVNDKTGDREMKILVTPITRFYGKHEDLTKQKDEESSRSRYYMSDKSAPKISFKQHLKLFLDAQRVSSKSKSDEVK